MKDKGWEGMQVPLDYLTLIGHIVFSLNNRSFSLEKKITLFTIIKSTRLPSAVRCIRPPLGLERPTGDRSDGHVIKGVTTDCALSLTTAWV